MHISYLCCHECVILLSLDVEAEVLRSCFFIGTFNEDKDDYFIWSSKVRVQYIKRVKLSL